MCECDESLVMQLEQDFKSTLQQQQSLEQWAVWLKGVVGKILKPYEDGASFAKAAREFLLKWSFYRSVVFPVPRYLQKEMLTNYQLPCVCGIGTPLICFWPAL